MEDKDYCNLMLYAEGNNADKQPYQLHITELGFLKPYSVNSLKTVSGLIVGVIGGLEVKIEMNGIKIIDKNSEEVKYFCINLGNRHNIRVIRTRKGRYVTVDQYELREWIDNI